MDYFEVKNKEKESLVRVPIIFFVIERCLHDLLFCGSGLMKTPDRIFLASDKFSVTLFVVYSLGRMSWELFHR
jgi:hypothetical protein